MFPIAIYVDWDRCSWHCLKLKAWCYTERSEAALVGFIKFACIWYPSYSYTDYIAQRCFHKTCFALHLIISICYYTTVLYWFYHWLCTLYLHCGALYSVLHCAALVFKRLVLASIFVLQYNVLTWILLHYIALYSSYFLNYILNLYFSSFQWILERSAALPWLCLPFCGSCTFPAVCSSTVNFVWFEWQVLLLLKSVH